MMDIELFKSDMDEEGWIKLSKISTTLEATSGWDDVRVHIPSETWLGRARVIPGWRLKGGHLKDIMSTSDLEICCAGDVEFYDSMVKMLKTIVHANYKKGWKNPLFTVPPISIIKPSFLDKDFCTYIEHLYNDAKTFLNQNQSEV